MPTNVEVNRLIGICKPIVPLTKFRKNNKIAPMTTLITSLLNHLIVAGLNKATMKITIPPIITPCSTIVSPYPTILIIIGGYV